MDKQIERVAKAIYLAGIDYALGPEDATDKAWDELREPRKSVAMFEARAAIAAYVPEWQPLESLPYDETVLIGWTDGSVIQDFFYDETLREWLSCRTRKPFHDNDPLVVPYCWMRETPLPEPPALTGQEGGE
jgi:hypothetical protein